MTEKTKFHAEITEHDSYALLLGNEIPFLADVLRGKLEDTGCIVHKKPQSNTKYDYLLVFGAPNNLEKEFSRLKQGGKAVFMITDDHKLEQNDSEFPIVSLSSNKQFSAESLASTILKKLFTSQPYTEKAQKNIDEKPLKKKQKSKKKKSKKNYRKRLSNKTIRRAMLFLAVLCLILVPFLLFGFSIKTSTHNLQQAIDTSTSLSSRKNNIRAAKTANTTAATIFGVADPILSLFSHSLSEIGTNAISILTQTTLAADELLEAETVLAINAGSLREPNANLFTTTLPDVQRRLATADQYLESAARSVSALEPYKNWAGIENRWEKLQLIPRSRDLLSQADTILSMLPDLLAHTTEKKYLILFQNNFELRPTGGFIGSYGTLTVADGAIIDFTIEDVYEADGQLKGSVSPPDPIREHMDQPNWFLRDSNWHPDFATSAKQAEWFLKKERNEVYDGVLAIDLYVIQNTLKALDGVYVPDYQATVTADDFFLKLQADTHSDFFPGSTKKKDLIRSLASSLMIELSERDDLPYIQLLSALHRSLEEKHILISLHDPDAQEVINQNGWGAAIVSPSQETTSLSPYRSDYLMLVEANLGVNKANYYIDREIFTSIQMSEDRIYREVIVYFKNNSPYRKSLFSGSYKNYIRLLIPDDSVLDEVLVNETSLDINTQVDQEMVSNKLSIGLLTTVEPQEEAKVILKYNLKTPSETTFLYQLMIQKQPGTDHDPFVFKIKTEPFWEITQSSLSSTPFLSELITDQLITVDFVRK